MLSRTHRLGDGCTEIGLLTRRETTWVDRASPRPTPCRTEGALMDGGSIEIRRDESRATTPISVEFDRLTIHGRLARNAEEERQFRCDPVFRVLVGVGRGSVLHGTD